MLTALLVARLCDQYVSALWRGESAEVHRFGVWLRGHWALGPDEPAAPPAAFSTVGGGGAGIRWHHLDGVLCGYIPGVPARCYQIRVDEEPPALDGSASREHALAVSRGSN